MTPYEKRDAIIKLLLDKIKNGREKNITIDEVTNFPPIFVGNDDLIMPSFTKDFYNKLSKETIKEKKLSVASGKGRFFHSNVVN